jgi:hypothetical protein
MYAMNSEDEALILGGIWGMVNSGSISDAAITRLGGCVAYAPSEAIRFAAAAALADSGAAALQVLDELLIAASEVRTFDMVSAVAEAIAAAGVPAVPALVQAVRDGDVRRTSILGLSIARMGDSGALAVGDALRSEQNSDVAALLVLTVQELGPRADAMVPVLAELLDSAEDEEFAQAILAALVAIGPGVVLAAPAILRAIGRCSDELSIWAERALWNAGPSVIGLIEAASETVPRAAEVRLRRVVSGLGSIERQGRLDRWFVARNDDKLLRTFVAVGDILVKRGPTSYLEMEGLFAAEPHSACDFPTSRSALGRCVRTIEQERDCRLTTHRSRSKGDLTDEGRWFLSSAKSYLRRKAAAQGKQEIY